MAREPLRKEVDRTFRCVEEDLLFPGKMELVGHEFEEPGGGIMWKEGNARASCPNSPFHRIELVKE